MSEMLPTRRGRRVPLQVTSAWYSCAWVMSHSLACKLLPLLGAKFPLDRNRIVNIFAACSLDLVVLVRRLTEALARVPADDDRYSVHLRRRHESYRRTRRLDYVADPTHEGGLGRLRLGAWDHGRN